MSDKKFEDVALIKLDGTMVKVDGTEKKSSFFDFLKVPLDEWDAITFTPEEAIRIKQQLQRLSTGASAAIYLTCGGPEVCPFATKCPYVQADRARKAVDPSAKGIVPIGSECPVEIQMMDQWSFLYAKEYEIEDGNFTEWSMVRELAEIELMMWRINNNMAKSQNSELVQENVVGMTTTGDGPPVPITRMEVSAFFEAKERLSNRRSKIVKLMVGDRQEKYKREAALKQQMIPLPLPPSCVTISTRSSMSPRPWILSCLSPRLKSLRYLKFPRLLPPINSSLLSLVTPPKNKAIMKSNG